MRTTTNTTKDTKTLLYVGCFAHDGSFLYGAFSTADTSKSDAYAHPLHDIVRTADALGVKVASTVTVRL